MGRLIHASKSQVCCIVALALGLHFACRTNQRRCQQRLVGGQGLHAGFGWQEQHQRGH